MIDLLCVSPLRADPTAEYGRFQDDGHGGGVKGYGSDHAEAAAGEAAQLRRFLVSV